MTARRPFWKWHRWKSIGFCLWPPSTCIWNLKLKFQSKLDLCSGNHVVYRQKDRRTDGRTDKVNPVYPPSNFVGQGYKKRKHYTTVTWHCGRNKRWRYYNGREFCIGHLCYCKNLHAIIKIKICCQDGTLNKVSIRYMICHTVRRLTERFRGL